MYTPFSPILNDQDGWRKRFLSTVPLIVLRIRQQNMNKLTQAIQLYKNMGARYVGYRLRYELEKKLGILKRRHPKELVLKQPISKKAWQEMPKNFVIPCKEELTIKKNPRPELKGKAERILNGDLPYFNAEWLTIGKDYNWLRIPENDSRYDIHKHWSEIPDLSAEAGYIKYVWEKSRFSYLLTLIRYDYHFDIDLSEFVLSEIESWIEANPINRGPNW